MIKLLVAVVAIFWTVSCVEAGRNECTSWGVWPNVAGDSLQAVVNAHPCTYLPAGVHYTNRGAKVPPGHLVTGAGIDATVLRADPRTFPIDSSALLSSWGGGEARIVANMTLDASNVAVQPLGYRDLTAVHVRLINGLCAGLVVAGPNVILADSQVHHNSHPSFVPGRGWLDCTDNPLGGFIYGAGVYVSPGDHAPVIVRTTITDSYGPGIDSWGGRGGYVAQSTITSNIGWAAIHLYGGATDWALVENHISQRDASYLPYGQESCYPHSWFGGAAIRACQDSGGLIVVRSTLHGDYALLTAVNSVPLYLDDNVYSGMVAR